MTERHVILVAEDEPEMAEELLELLEVQGFDTIHVSNLEDGLGAGKKGGFCLALVDLQMPLGPKKGRSSPEAGRMLIEGLREMYPHRNDKRKSLLSIIVLSGNAREHEDVMAAIHAGADDFLKKPLSTGKRSLKDVLRSWFAISSRDDHERCPAITSEARTGVPSVRLVLTGVAIDRRLEVVLGGRSIPLSVASFVTLLRLVAARERSADGRLHRDQLGARDTQALQAASRLRQELRVHMPRNIDPVRSAGIKHYCLDPSIELAPVDWRSFQEHSDVDVQRFARSLNKESES
jgi:DNA-binding response OmpR family regulator